MTDNDMTMRIEKAEHDIKILKSDAQDFRYGLESVFEALNRISDQQEKFMRVQAEIQAAHKQSDIRLARIEDIVEKLAEKQFEYEERQAKADERQAKADERQAKADERQAKADEQQARDRERISTIEKNIDNLTQTVNRYIASRNNGGNGQS